MFIQKIKKRLHYYFFEEDWNIGFAKINENDLLGQNYLSNIKWLGYKGNFFLADPFGVHDFFENTVFCEYYSFKKRKGIIVKVEFDKNFKLTSLEKLIDEPCHMSYPYIFKENKNIWCIPESYQANKIDMYTINKKGGLKKERIFIDGLPVIDPTVFEYKGKWWLACSLRNGRENKELHIYYSKDLNKWTPHKSNPVKIDIKSCRGAGPPFLYKNELYRPSQDCSI